MDEPVTINLDGPATTTISVICPGYEIPLGNDGSHSFTVLCADGSRVEIKPGKCKVFQTCARDNRFHLLDCVCETCRPATEDSPEPEGT